jgi:hypothetical protein
LQNLVSRVEQRRLRIDRNNFCPVVFLCAKSNC